MTKVLAIDPGETTGYVLATLNGEDIPPMEEFGVLSYWRGVRQLVRTHRPDVIVMEAFRLRAGKARTQINSDMPAPQVIGAVRLIGEEEDIPVVIQSSSVGFGRGRLPQEVFDSFESVHVRAAFCHLVAYRRSL